MSQDKKKFGLGIRLKPTDKPTKSDGDISISSVDNKIKVTTQKYDSYDAIVYAVGDVVRFDDDGLNYICIQVTTGVEDPTDPLFFEVYERSVVTEDQTQTLTNKTIDTSTSGTNTLVADSSDILYDDSLEASRVLGNNVQDALDAVKVQLEGQDQAEEITYDNADSGLVATNVKTALDELDTDVDALETSATEIDANVDDLVTLSGVAENSVDLGVFTGTTITDNITVKPALQELENNIESVESRVTTNETGITTNQNNITEIDGNLDDLITLTGVAENATDLGTFTGTTIDDNTTIQNALQQLEIATEAGSDDKVDKVASTDNAIVRFDGITGDVQDSGVKISDTDTISGVALLAVDQLTLDSNNISNNTGGDISLSPTPGDNVNIREAAYIENLLKYESHTDTTAGSLTTLTVPTTVVKTLTGALVSVMSIDVPISGMNYNKLVILNKTGGVVTFINESGTVGEQIITGTGENLVVEDDAAISLIYVNSTLQWQVIGGAGGAAGEDIGGAFNFVTNGKADVDILGWNTYGNTTAGPVPDDFLGGTSGNLTFTRNTTTPLVGDADFKLSKAAANVQGEGVYYEFDAVNGYQATKVLLQAVADLSEIDDGDLRVYLVGSSDGFGLDFNLISPNNPDVKAGLKTITKQLQLSPVDTQYRLCLHYASTDTIAKDIYIDEVTLGPSPVTSGSNPEIIAEGISNGAGTINTTQNIDWTETRDTTDSFNGTQFTAPESGDYSIEGGIQISAATTVNFRAYIDGTVNKNLSPSINSTVHSISGTVYLNKGEILSIRPTATVTLVAVTVNHTIHIQKIGDTPENNSIAGGRDIIVAAAGNDSDSIVIGEDIPFKTTQRDTTSSWSDAGNTGSGQRDAFTAPETGGYLIKGGIYYPTTAKTVNALAYINGTIDSYIGFSESATTGVLDLNGLIYLEKDDVLTIRVDQDITLGNVNSLHYIRIQKLASPQTILETATVAARYTSGNASVVANGSPFVFENKDYDTHGAFTSNTTFTAPVSGFYTVNTRMRSGTVGVLYTALHVNDILVGASVPNSNQNHTTFNSDTFNLNKGDTVKLINLSGSSRTQTADNAYVTFAIIRNK